MTSSVGDHELLELLDGIVWLAEADTLRTVFVTLRAQEIFGHGVEDFVHRCLHPEDREGILRSLRAVALDGNGRRLEHRTVDKNGSVRWFRTDVRRHGTRLFGFMREVTDEREDAEFWHGRARYLRALLTHAPAIMFGFDNAGTFTLFEGKGVEALGFKPGELVGASAFERYADHAWIVDSVRSALLGEKVAAHGEIGGISYESQFVPQRDDSGHVVGVIGFATDVTERMQAEQRSRRSERQLAEAQRIAHIGSWDWDIAQNEVACSDEFYRIYGVQTRQLRRVSIRMGR